MRYLRGCCVPADTDKIVVASSHSLFVVRPKSPPNVIQLDGHEGAGPPGTRDHHRPNPYQQTPRFFFRILVPIVCIPSATFDVLGAITHLHWMPMSDTYMLLSISTDETFRVLVKMRARTICQLSTFPTY